LRELLGDLQDRIELLIGTRDKMDGLIDAVLAVEAASRGRRASGCTTPSPSSPTTHRSTRR
jgi:hypothetical protein